MKYKNIITVIIPIFYNDYNIINNFEQVTNYTFSVLKNKFNQLLTINEIARIIVITNSSLVMSKLINLNVVYAQYTDENNFTKSMIKMLKNPKTLQITDYILITDVLSIFLNTTDYQRCIDIFLYNISIHINNLLELVEEEEKVEKKKKNKFDSVVSVTNSLGIILIEKELFLENSSFYTFKPFYYCLSNIKNLNIYSDFELCSNLVLKYYHNNNKAQQIETNELIEIIKLEDINLFSDI